MAEQINAKALHVLIKRGCTSSELMEKFGLSDEKQLFERIHQISPVGALDFISQIRKNNKSARRRERKEANKLVEVQQDLPKVENSTEEVTATVFEETSSDVIQEVQPVEDNSSSKEIQPVEDNSSNKEIQPIEDNSSIQNTSISHLEELQEKETLLSQDIISDEEAHKEMVARRREINLSFKKVKNALSELQRLLKLNEEKTSALIEEYNDLSTKMRTKSSDIKAKKAILADIREQIDNLKKCVVYVFADGNIEVENASISDVDDDEDEVAERLLTLVQYAEAEELTIKDLKTIAKLELMVAELIADGINYELFFDSETVQKFYETVTA
jgi:chromosome segregation ATPase